MLDLSFINVAYAAGSVDSFIGNVNKLILNPLIGLLFALALVYFLWGMYEFLANEANQDKKTVGKSHMVWGLVGITIMFAVWTILNIVLGTLGISPDEINPEEGTVELNDYSPNYPGVGGGTGPVGATGTTTTPPTTAGGGAAVY